MLVQLTKKEVGTIVAGLYWAIESEYDLIRCHADQFTKRSIDTETTSTAKAFIRRMKKLRAKLTAALENRK